MQEKKYEAFDLLHTICDAISKYEVKGGRQSSMKVTLELPLETYEKFQIELLKVHPSANISDITIAWFNFTIKALP